MDSNQLEDINTKLDWLMSITSELYVKFNSFNNLESKIDDCTNSINILNSLVNEISLKINKPTIGPPPPPQLPKIVKKNISNSNFKKNSVKSKNNTPLQMQNLAIKLSKYIFRIYYCLNKYYNCKDNKNSKKPNDFNENYNLATNVFNARGATNIDKKQITIYMKTFGLNKNLKNVKNNMFVKLFEELSQKSIYKQEINDILFELFIKNKKQGSKNTIKNIKNIKNTKQISIHNKSQTMKKITI